MEKYNPASIEPAEQQDIIENFKPFNIADETGHLCDKIIEQALEVDEDADEPAD